MSYALAVHGGAGTIGVGAADEAPYHAGLRAALAAGEAVLKTGGSALDAAIAATLALEDEPLFNAGRGAVFTADATHEMDAGVMDGSTLAAGAVAGIHTVKNPVLLARAVMEKSPCVLLAGAGAERFAREQGFAETPASYFHTDARRAQLERVRSDAGAAVGKSGMALDHTGASITPPINEDKKFGTVGAVARDIHGHLASAVSTGGMTNKRVGRVGDSPIVGAGFYANDATCAVCATGTGEFFIRACAAHDIHARMAYGGATLAAAADAVVMGELTRLGGSGGVIAIDRLGNIALPFNSTGMYRGWVRAGEGGQTRIFA
jgi:L-asparaginase / beta-aspartyl-peptidase